MYPPPPSFHKVSARFTLTLTPMGNPPSVLGERTSVSITILGSDNPYGVIQFYSDPTIVTTGKKRHYQSSFFKMNLSSLSNIDLHIPPPLIEESLRDFGRWQHYLRFRIKVFRKPSESREKNLMDSDILNLMILLLEF